MRWSCLLDKPLSGKSLEERQLSLRAQFARADLDVSDCSARLTRRRLETMAARVLALLSSPIATQVMSCCFLHRFVQRLFATAVTLAAQTC